MKPFKTLIGMLVCLIVACNATAAPPPFSATINIIGDTTISVGETTTLTATWSTNRDVTRCEWKVDGVSQGVINFDGSSLGYSNFDFSSMTPGTYEVCFHIWHHQQTDRDATTCITITVIEDDYYFAGWRPPVNLPGPADGWKSGSTMPVKFLVVDATGDPVTDGVNTYVSIGYSVAVLAVLDDAIIGQWKAEIVLVGDGIQEVEIDGNVMNVDYLEIEVRY